MAFSPDGALLATASEDGTTRIWSAATGAPRATLTGHDGPVTGVAFLPGGAVAITTSQDGTAMLWDVADVAMAARLVPLPGGGAAVLLPDGAYKIDGESGGRLWWAMKLCRFGPGELDAYGPGIRRLPDSEPIRP
ncbi:MAG TPA: hypothetical protein VH478_09030 [Trebonia sp.]|nr:hypothetical protein [Trebonia sp.]